MTSLLLAIIYIAFISLGLPDAMLGAAWPSIYTDLSVPVSYAGILSALIAAMTIVSSLQSERLTLKLGTGKITAISVAITCVALFGFSVSHSFWALCLWAIPYGLGAGSVDASLNNYVALNFKSKHMSWLHCMWGVGAATGPYVMGHALTSGMGWNASYRIVAFIQIALTAILLFSLPLWNKNHKKENTREPNSSENPSDEKTQDSPKKALPLKAVLKIPGAKAAMLTFFCYCAIEQTAGLWAASYLSLYKGVSVETAAFFASMFYLGITAGRAVSGFMTFKFNDSQMVRIGQMLLALGAIAMFLPGPTPLSIAGFILMGLGCAPIYPCMIHATPERFGSERSQAIIGVQMASAYIGTSLMPPIFGFLAGFLGLSLLPFYLFALLTLMFFMFNKVTNRKQTA